MDRVRRTSMIAAGIGTLAVSAVATAAFAASQAYTDNMYPTDNADWTCRDSDYGYEFCKTDNANLTVYRQGSLSASGKAKIKEMLGEQYSPTQLKVYIRNSGVYTGGSETDVIYQNERIPGGWRGGTWCDDAIGNYKCDQQYVRFRYATPSYADTCHETGHAVGLTHGQDAAPKKDNKDRRLGCLVSPGTIKSLGSHNKEMINSTY
ncbi:hypothetical protein [Streptomyces sp. MNP-20]|uniref:hypothetical protein n=1 Tax=Streptomyces sp. MNP-20 TaxID=2721165 RepID=UPI0020A6BB11|nr:hypothetical protein [Streptomyces sp. MNP-20]